jgi:cell division protein FtsB
MLPRGFRNVAHPDTTSRPGDPQSFQPTNQGGPPPGSEAIPGGTVVAAGGAAPSPAAGTPRLPADGQPVPMPMPAPAPPGGIPLVAPRPLPAQPGPPTGSKPQPGTPPAPPPGTIPGLPPGAIPTGQGAFADPHLRSFPTVTGDRLNLAPWEAPADRVVDLTRQLESLNAQNAVLAARIKELNAQAAGREQARAEAAREVDATAAAAAKERAALEAQAAALRLRIKRLEEDDLAFLRAAIEALGRLLPPEKKP